MKNNNLVKLIKKEYQLIEPIGSGGAGDVWLVENGGKNYAIKFLKKESDSKKIKRFKKELDFSRSLNRDDIVKCLDDGVVYERYCYAMPYYEKTFIDVIQEEKDGAKLLEYIIDIAKAIKFIHGENVIHRDIKPENILFDDDRKKIVLADFGIAHFKDFSLTKTNDCLANRDYCAPEQRIRKNAKEITTAVDIYSFGLIISECFTKFPRALVNPKSIVTDYPLYSYIDKLVSAMLEQTPEKRIDINTVLIELGFVREKTQEEIGSIKDNLIYQLRDLDVDENILDKISSRASHDLLFAKYLLTSKNDLKKYNPNWHMKIGYNANEYLLNACIAGRILARCLAKFDYESVGFFDKNTVVALDLSKNDDREYYDKMKKILIHHKVRKDVGGKILKLFSACKGYHCKEILSSILDDIDEAKENLSNAPILWLLCHIKEYSCNVPELIENVPSAIEEYIQISIDIVETYETNKDVAELYDVDNLRAKKVLDILKERYNASFFNTGTRYEKMSVKFSEKDYLAFKKFSLEKGKMLLNKDKSLELFLVDTYDIFNCYTTYYGDYVVVSLDSFYTDSILAKVFDIEREF